MEKNIEVEIKKSSRHSKIAGDFTESLVLYLLSKHGFECANVDHTGIDIIAKNPLNSELMGISVKGRTREKGQERQYVRISKDNFEKIDLACIAFGCTPYFAIMVDEDNMLKLYILSKIHLLQLFPLKDSGVGWKMTKENIEKYQNDSEIIKIKYDYRIENWWAKK